MERPAGAASHTFIQARTSGLGALVALVLVEGYVSVSVEVLTIRQLIPFVGNSVVVTSLIIGFFLLFLALGYQRGGCRRSGFRATLRRNFLLAAALLAVGLSYPFIQRFFAFIGRLGIGDIAALTAYLLLITSPLAYLLGQTVPIATNLFPGQLVGAISGRVLFLSTLGSFLGAVLTTLVLMNWLGVGATVLIDFVLLAALTVLISERSLLAPAALVLLLGVAYALNVDYNRRAFVADNAYGNYVVMARPDGRELHVNNSHSSRLGRDGEGYWYVETIRRLLFREAGLHDQDILVLGAGGFTLSRPGDANRYIYVDIDGDIRRIVAEHFNPDIVGEFAGEDARTFVMRTDKRYGAIVSDAYLNRISIPSHLLTVEHFRALAGRLTDQGIAVFNLILNPFMSDPYSRRVDNTLRAVFRHCAVIPRYYHDGATNVIYACRSPGEHADASVYSDDRNPATFDMTRLR